MLKKLMMAACTLGVAFSAQAFDKNQVALDKEFWGTWSVYNAKTQCSEKYQFNKPGQFNYTAKQKKMSGEFAIMRSKDAKELDILAMKVKSDNKVAGCGGQATDYTNADIRLGLKWVSKTTAEICSDVAGKQCTGLYLIKQS